MTTSPVNLSHAAFQPEQLASAAQTNRHFIPAILEGMKSDQARVRFGCAKALRLVAASKPDALYPNWDDFVRLLDHPNKIFQWEGAIVLSHLAQVDNGGKFKRVFGKYFSPIPGPVMITAANVIGGAARIARAQPHLADRIAAEVLKVATASYATPECRNVAIGHAITAFGGFLDLLSNPEPVVRFVRRQLKNPRLATRKKAERLLKGISSPNWANRPGRSRTNHSA